jgi:hypothetical protein
MKGFTARAVAVLFALAPAALAAPPDRTQRCVDDSDRGQEQRDRGALLEARAYFRACATDECPAMVRKDCADWLAALEVNLPSVVLGAKDAAGADLLGVRVLIDGELHAEEAASGRAIALDPGPHHFHFEHPPDAPIELTAVLRVGEHNRPIFATFAAAPAAAPVAGGAPSAPPAPSGDVASVTATHVSAWAYGFGAAALVAGGAFAYLGATGLSEKGQLRATCGDTCTDAQVAPLKTRYIAADTSLAVGVLSAAVAGWLFLHPDVERARATGASVSVGLAPGRATIDLAARF